VPFHNLIECLAYGHSLDDLLNGFPSVDRDQAIAAFEEAKEQLLAKFTNALGGSEPCCQSPHPKIRLNSRPVIRQQFSLMLYICSHGLKTK
jgi:hypothetical protein